MVVIEPQQVIFNRGDNVSLSCSAMGGPNFYQWMKDGMTTSNGPVLEISFLDATDGGEYTCVASNAAGSINASVGFNVSPDNVMSPLNTSSEAGERATLNCSAEAFPPPVYEWFRLDGSEFGVNVTGINSSTLVFDPVQFGDEGGYYCEADSNGTVVNSETAILAGKHTGIR